MDKLTFTETLRGLGFNAVLDQGVVMVEAAETSALMDRLRTLAKEYGYEGSYGWRKLAEEA